MQRSRRSASATALAVLPSLVGVRPLAASLAAGAVLLSAPLAHADFDFELGAGGGIKWMRTLPTLQAEATNTSARSLPAQDVATGGGSVTALGGSFDLSVVLDDHWMIPGFGLGVYGAIGSYPSVLTTVDGSIARVRPWTMFAIDLLSPGIGYRIKKRRFMFSGAIRSGVSIMHVDGSIAGAKDEQPMALTGVSVLVQAELEACRRLDPVTRVCLQVAPRLYDFGSLNGATFGLRVEWGR